MDCDTIELERDAGLHSPQFNIVAISLGHETQGFRVTLNNFGSVVMERPWDTKYLSVLDRVLLII